MPDPRTPLQGESEGSHLQPLWPWPEAADLVQIQNIHLGGLRSPCRVLRAQGRGVQAEHLGLCLLTQPGGHNASSSQHL